MNISNAKFYRSKSLSVKVYFSSVSDTGKAEDGKKLFPKRREHITVIRYSSGRGRTM
jgi:hypothetical protein